MKDIDEIRRENLRTLEREAGGPTPMASRVGMSLSQYVNLRDGAKDSKTGKPRGMRKGTARKIEEQCGKSAGWLDVLHDGYAATPSLEAPSAIAIQPSLYAAWAAYNEAKPDIKAIVDFILAGRLATAPEWVKENEQVQDKVWSAVGFASEQFDKFKEEKKTDHKLTSDMVKRTGNTG